MRASLKILQTQKNYSNDKMAEIGGVHRVTYYRVLNNKIEGGFLFWMNIKKHFNLSTEKIIAMFLENVKTN